MALDRTSASRFLVPLGAVAALAVAIGVWLVPSSALDPNPPDVGEARGPLPERPMIERQVVPPEKGWMEIAQRLESLREPDAAVEDEEPETPPEEGTGTDNPPPPTPRVTVGWEYEGLVEQPDRVAALIRILGVQRFVFEGEEVSDASLPAGVTAVIAEVTPDHIVVRVGGGEQRIERSNDAPPVHAPPVPRRSPRNNSPRQRKT